MRDGGGRPEFNQWELSASVRRPRSVALEEGGAGLQGGVMVKKRGYKTVGLHLFLPFFVIREGISSSLAYL